jgi:cold shock protein
MKGKIKFYHQAKGFGFIKCTDTGEEIFFHATAINPINGIHRQTVFENDEVEFTIQSTTRGTSAKDITVTKKAGGKTPIWEQ